jgi:hypothetical protein
VTWSCGYGDAAADVPAPIIHAAKLLVGHYHLNREATAAAAPSRRCRWRIDALIQPYRGPGLA